MENLELTREDLQNIPLEEILDRYATLRDTIQSLEEEKTLLSEHLKKHLRQGIEISCDIYTAQLKTSQKKEYNFDLFLQKFGLDNTLKVSSIDQKKIKKLLEEKNIEESDLKDLTTIKEIQSLYLLPK